ncbi:helix-turn-helix domain-containing protein [Sphingosinicella rhizophila]|uniref:XRE family transcriptional regulator n=1 Tax=Sphingosinicella rhizophila TaxID=3050082 RepID=A0ABU3Q8R7_9SPHN|nr:XRE family transcriptional regulator [Sphingosinicella sp. GR2756]MDT9599712.1 XRE family transcriptional regulator [Sphingosinicella sp. GR2756]
MSKSQPTLGKLLRTLRSRNGWTLKQMSDHSGIPVSTLSKVEHDRLTLTYDKLLQLSQRLGIRLSDLFAENEEGHSGPVTARRSFGRIDQAVQVMTANYDYHYLCTELRRKRMIPLVTKIRAKSMEEFGDLVRHSGEEYIYVLDGRVEVQTEFYDPVVLGPGESMYLDSQMGHAYLAAEGCREATVLAVCSSPEEAYMNWLTDIRDSMAGRSGNDKKATIEDLHHFATGRKVSRLGTLQDVED